MNYKIKKFTQELNECESEFIERVRKFFQTYIRLDNYHLINVEWYKSEKERTLLNCIVIYYIKDCLEVQNGINRKTKTFY